MKASGYEQGFQVCTILAPLFSYNSICGVFSNNILPSSSDGEQLKQWQ